MHRVPAASSPAVASDVDEFAKFYPKLFEEYNVKELDTPFMKMSNDMSREDWISIAESVGKIHFAGQT